MAEHVLWHQTASEQTGYESLNSDVTADVIVIGGGFTGTSAALHMAQMGMNVALLEAQTIGHGASGRNVGLVNAGLWTPPEDVIKKIGQQAGTRVNKVLAEGPDLVFDLINDFQISCEATRQGTLHCAHSPAGMNDLKNRYRQQIDRGAPVKLIDAEEIAERTGSNSFYGALWDARAGTIQPTSYVRGLARAAISAGAKLYENSEVTQMEKTGSDWKVSTASGSVTAPRLIQATNAYGTKKLRENIFTLTHYFQFATEPLSKEQLKRILPGGEGCWDTALIMSSFRLDRAGRMILGAIGSLDHFGSDVHAGWARRKLAALFPDLADIPFEHSWTGRIAMSNNYLPRVEHIGENAITICGYSGRGISPGTMFGKCAADWAMTGNPDAFPIPITEPKPYHLKKAKSLYFESGATAKHFVSDRF